MIRCKFRVFSKTEFQENDQCKKPVLVKLQPVTGEPFGEYTPMGSIELQIQNNEAEKQFVVGKEYFVDFTPAE